MAKKDIDLTELSFDALQGGMDKQSFEKAIKKPMTWRNKKAVILLTNFKIEGKGTKRAVVVPYKKIEDAKDVFKKQLQKDPSIQMKNIFVGHIDFDQKETEVAVAKIQKVLGSAKKEEVLKQGTSLFSLMGFELEVLTKREGKKEKIEEADFDDLKAISIAELNVLAKELELLLEKGETTPIDKLLAFQSLKDTFSLELKKHKGIHSYKNIIAWELSLTKCNAFLLEHGDAIFAERKKSLNLFYEKINKFLDERPKFDELPDLIELKTAFSIQALSYQLSYPFEFEDARDCESLLERCSIIEQDLLAKKQLVLDKQRVVRDQLGAKIKEKTDKGIPSTIAELDLFGDTIDATMDTLDGIYDVNKVGVVGSFKLQFNVLCEQINRCLKAGDKKKLKEQRKALEELLKDFKEYCPREEISNHWLESLKKTTDVLEEWDEFELKSKKTLMDLSLEIRDIMSGKIKVKELLKLEKLAESFNKELMTWQKLDLNEEESDWVKTLKKYEGLLKKVKELLKTQEVALVKAKKQIDKKLAEKELNLKCKEIEKMLLSLPEDENGMAELFDLKKLTVTFQKKLEAYRNTNPEEDISDWTKILVKAIKRASEVLKPLDPIKTELQEIPKEDEVPFSLDKEAKD